MFQFDKYDVLWKNIRIYKIYKNENGDKVIKFLVRTYHEVSDQTDYDFRYMEFPESCEMLLDDYCAYDTYSNYKKLMRQYDSNRNAYQKVTPQDCLGLVNGYIKEYCSDIKMLDAISVKRDTEEGYYY